MAGSECFNPQWSIETTATCSTLAMSRPIQSFNPQLPQGATATDDLQLFLIVNTHARCLSTAPPTTPPQNLRKPPPRPSRVAVCESLV